MNNKIDRTGEIYNFEDGRNMQIIEYFSARNVTIKFNDETIIKNITYRCFRLGKVENFNNKSIFGIGYFGYGKYRYKGKYKSCYDKWRKMIGRCYDEYTQIKNPTYKDCSVHPDWHNFQNFAKWYDENYIDGFELDKDILVKGNKIYSSETCCFVPQEINKLLTLNDINRGSLPIGVSIKKGKKKKPYNAQINIVGKPKSLGYFYTIQDAFNAYKIAKENRIKYLAYKHKGNITENCYNSLINWVIEIND